MNLYFLIGRYLNQQMILDLMFVFVVDLVQIDP
jgi:hypothetical protein